MIHAGKGVDKNAMKRFEHLNLEYPSGCIIAKATLADCVEIDDAMKITLREKNFLVYQGTTEDADWHGYGFKMENVEKMSPFPIDGKLSLWDFEE